MNVRYDFAALREFESRLWCRYYLVGMVDGTFNRLYFRVPEDAEVSLNDCMAVFDGSGNLIRVFTITEKYSRTISKKGDTMEKTFIVI